MNNPKLLPREPIRKRLLSVQETAVYLGRSVTAIRELIWAGKLPYVREGRRVHCDIYDLERWIEDRKTSFTY